ncbi:hypothetical protein [Pararhizobium sp. PWRC1-1]|uniref:hypothetical protein n=1 Tax=Pararhizobium sp. PWRC1-1 TaxID=2804566 RepID=UPI003CF812E4
MMTLTLANDRMSLTLVPEYGARITGLRDRLTGRQWLIPGDLSTDTGSDAIYGADQARGWDECFPTVAPCKHPSWGILRDHGVLWGTAWDVVEASVDCIDTQYVSPDFRFVRRLSLHDATLTADYAVTNRAAAPLAYLWSQHCLLAVTPEDRIALCGCDNLTADELPYDWPDYPRRDLSRIGTASDGFALKSYAMTPAVASAEIVNPDGGIRFCWDGIPAFGLWQSFGGWPADDPVHQVALEPATAAADHLVAAEAIGQAKTVEPRATHRWSVRVTLTAPNRRTQN